MSTQRRTKSPAPLDIHFALKRCGSGFSDIARRASKGRRVVTPSNVRGVIYGYTHKNAALILATIDLILKENARQPQARERALSVTG